MLRTIRWCTLLAFAGAVTSACGDDFSLEDVLGVWEATSVNGYEVPGLAVVNDVEYEVQYYRYTFDIGGFCTSSFSIDGDQFTDSCEYTVSEVNGAIYIDHGVYEAQGTIDGNRMSLTDTDGVQLVLQKQ